MRRMRVIALLMVVMIYTTTANSQTTIDALRFSQTTFGPTARSLSMSGAFGALGGDFSSLSENPAGIGVYRSSEFSMSPAFHFKTIDGEFGGRTETDNNFNFNFGNIGFVFSNSNQRNEGWNSVNFAFGYNKINTFKNNSIYSGINTSNSLLQAYAQRLNANGGIYPSELNTLSEEYLAYYLFLIDTMPGDSSMYFSSVDGGGVNQKRILNSRGSIGEVVFTVGGNYSDKLYLGATMGITSLSYEEESLYEETDPGNVLNNPVSTVDFDSMGVRQSLTTNGTGVNLKFGVIFRPEPWLRVGAAIHTPTWYSMADDYEVEMGADFSNTTNGPFSISTGSLPLAYRFNSPFKAILSMAFIFEKQGLISFDYEVVDYSKAKFSSSEFSYSSVNDAVGDIYQATSNYRLGLEYRYEIFSFRAGAAYYGSPFKASVRPDEGDGSRLSFSGGLGFREKAYFFDLGYALTMYDEFYRHYSLAGSTVPNAVYSARDHRFLVSMGVKF